ncbi:hypothetical protein [Anaerostipes faecalis]|uniref:hypothetical protein n=1 Tax=Anaerostipes faecalis TaxID=2738446 RepID=UPI003F042714
MLDDVITADGKLPELSGSEKSMVENFKTQSMVGFQQEMEQNQKKMLDMINEASRGKKLTEDIKKIEKNQIQQIKNQEEQIEYLRDLIKYQKDKICKLENIFASLEDSTVVNKMILQELQKEDKSLLKDLVEKIGVSEATVLLNGAIKSIVAMSNIF